MAAAVRDWKACPEGEGSVLFSKVPESRMKLHGRVRFHLNRRDQQGLALRMEIAYKWCHAIELEGMGALFHVSLKSI